jgi:hypothetical protein
LATRMVIVCSAECPSGANAFTVSVCGPSGSVVVSISQPHGRLAWASWKAPSTQFSVRTTGPLDSARQLPGPSCRKPATVCPSCGEIQRIPIGAGPTRSQPTVPARAHAERAGDLVRALRRRLEPHADDAVVAATRERGRVGDGKGHAGKTGRGHLHAGEPLEAVVEADDGVADVGCQKGRDVLTDDPQRERTGRAHVARAARHVPEADRRRDEPREDVDVAVFFVVEGHGRRDDALVVVLRGRTDGRRSASARRPRRR